MGAPNITFSANRKKISAVSGYDSLSVSFRSDGEYVSFECRATKVGETWGVGIGSMIALFSQTPANTERVFEIYDKYLLDGDGEYRISLYVQAADGSWNDTIGFVPLDYDETLLAADGNEFFCRKGDVSGAI